MSSTDHRSPRAPLTGAAAVAAVAVGYLLPGLAAEWAGLRPLLGIEDRTPDGTGYALTFDDGPHPQGTPRVLEILERAGVQATFFLVGEQVTRDPGLARAIVEAGHEIGLHCHRHRNLLRLTPGQVRADIAEAESIIQGATERSPTLYRPPYGVLNTAALRLARARAWRILLWSHWGRDWEARATPESITRLVTDGAGPGSILLLHDADEYSAHGSWERTVGALPAVLEILAQRGLRSVSL